MLRKRSQNRPRNGNGPLGSFSSPGLLALAVLALAAGAAAGEVPRIAIIIDDLGYRTTSGRRVVGLPGPVACAILPHTPHARALAELAHAHGKEVLLHLPLQAIGRGLEDMPGGIGVHTSAAELRRLFRENLAAVPYASGVNVHMGSLLTAQPGHMGWLMEELAGRPELFFVDSRTTPQSVAYHLALEHGVPAGRRQIFLDSVPEPEAVAAQYLLLLQFARRRGSAIAIGHPQPATLALLERELPLLSAQGIRLVPVAEIVYLSHNRTGDGESTGAAGRGL